MAKKSAMKKSGKGNMDFSLMSLHRAFNATRDRLKLKPKTPARDRLNRDLDGAQAMIKCDQGMFRQIAVAKKKPTT